MKQKMTRRQFIVETALTTASIGVAGRALAGKQSPYDAKGLPTRELGKTGVRVPFIVIGTGSRWCSVKDEDEALRILTYALDHGLYYWDTASTYRGENFFSEERIGKILKDRRKRVFLSTKVRERDPDKAKVQIETSLKRLQIDRLDLLQIHRIQSPEDVEDIGKKGGVYDIVRSFKEQGVCRFIGFTGHSDAEAMKLAAERYEFDTMLIALNHYQKGNEKFEEHAVPFAAQKGMGVLAMKVIRPREKNKNLKATDLIRYALSLKHVNAAVIGTDSLTVLKQNIELIKNFKPLSDPEMERLRVALAPFYRHEGLEWMHPAYEDGALA